MLACKSSHGGNYLKLYWCFFLKQRFIEGGEEHFVLIKNNHFLPSPDPVAFFFNVVLAGCVFVVFRYLSCFQIKGPGLDLSALDLKVQFIWRVPYYTTVVPWALLWSLLQKVVLGTGHVCPGTVHRRCGSKPGRACMSSAWAHSAQTWRGAAV